MIAAYPRRSAQGARRFALIGAQAGALVMATCAGPAGPPPPAAESGPPARAQGMREIFPHVRFDKDARIVEIDGEVPIDCHNPKTPRVYLEVTVCTRNSKEHETLVVTDAKPSHVHAALLLAGCIPDTPGSWRMNGNDLVRIQPEGGRLGVMIAYTGADGLEVSAPAQDWVVNARGNARLSDEGPIAWIFAGSRMVQYEGREYYDADGTGTLVGLTTFGSETVALARVLSPDSQVDEPEWIADRAKVPAYLTKVVVRISPER